MIGSLVIRILKKSLIWILSKTSHPSNPNTPYYKNGLEHIKDIGIRLLQIAQRRSDEAKCVGNIKLISKNESKTGIKILLV